VDERKRTVQAGYDSLASEFLVWTAKIEDDPRHRLLDDFVSRLPAEARVLDLGCGAGVPSTTRLAERFEVVGVDISKAQIELARQNVPRATLIHGDFADLDFSPGSFDGVTAFYSITHVPREQHADLFGRIASWLKPGGCFLASLSPRDSGDWSEDWLGVEMFFSGFDADTNRRLLRDAGFVLVLDDVISMSEPEGPAAFLWVIAQKPSGA
jgi:cyclopropane fatty-acyl-phospholipid synthase-like methyltransferase